MNRFMPPPRSNPMLQSRILFRLGNLRVFTHPRSVTATAPRRPNGRTQSVADIQAWALDGQLVAELGRLTDAQGICQQLSMSRDNSDQDSQSAAQNQKKPSPWRRGTDT